MEEELQFLKGNQGRSKWRKIFVKRTHTDRVVRNATFFGKQKIQDSFFRFLLLSSAMLVVLLVFCILFTLLITSAGSIKEFGWRFFVTNVWDYKNNIYGALAFISGTLLTSGLSLLISLPFSFSIAVLLSVYLKKGWIAGFIKLTTELLAGVPSVIYGFWGFYFLGPIIRNFASACGVMNNTGYGILTSSIVLAIMITPYSASLGREVMELVPNHLVEGGYSLGGTRFEVVTKIMIPFASSGIFAGVILSLGRALGETMAITMLIGNSNSIPTSLFDTGNTIASVIANEFNEADGVKLSALIELGFVLMVITFIVNFIGKYIIKKISLE